MNDVRRGAENFIDAAGWEAIQRGIATDEQLREVLSGSRADLRGEAVKLLAYLQAVRERLQALRATAEAAHRLGAAAQDSGGEA